MNRKTEWMLYQVSDDIGNYVAYRKNQFMDKITGKPYQRPIQYTRGHTVLNVQETNRYIAEKIKVGEPCWIGRYGGSEMNLITAVLEHRYRKNRDRRDQALDQLHFLSGFFPVDMKLGEQFVEKMIEVAPSLDLHGCWSLYMERYMVRAYEKNAVLTYLGYLEPWGMNYRFPLSERVFWTTAMEGKRILVIHPFEKTIKHQYENNREKIFQKAYTGENVLPEFELLTLKAVQSIAGNRDPRFETWFDALDWMEKECAKLEFDVALIGCGAYGFLLAAAIKKMGKIAIHLGGSTQILFGILGKRWENNQAFMENVVNDYWVHPLEEEKVENFSGVESGCYW